MEARRLDPDNDMLYEADAAVRKRARTVVAPESRVRALSLYQNEPLAVRLDARIRARVCPMRQVVTGVLTTSGCSRLGCGHGLF